MDIESILEIEAEDLHNLRGAIHSLHGLAGTSFYETLNQELIGRLLRRLEVLAILTETGFGEAVAVITNELKVVQRANAKSPERRVLEASLETAKENYLTAHDNLHGNYDRDSMNMYSLGAFPMDKIIQGIEKEYDQLCRDISGDVADYQLKIATDTINRYTEVLNSKFIKLSV